jgi:hypothetical protein
VKSYLEPDNLLLAESLPYAWSSWFVSLCWFIERLKVLKTNSGSKKIKYKWPKLYRY